MKKVTIVSLSICFLFVMGFVIISSGFLKTEKDYIKYEGSIYSNITELDWFEKEKSFRGFIHEIHHFGFRSKSHNLTVNKLLTHKINQASFAYANGHASEEFVNSIPQTQNDSLAIIIEAPSLNIFTDYLIVF